MPIAPVVAASLITGGSAIASSLFGKKKSSARQIPLEPPEVTQARRDLLAIGQNNNYNGLNMGEAYGGELGNFEMTGIENMGQSKLADFVGGARPEIFDTGSKALTELLTGSQYDPLNPNGEYASFKTQVERERRNAITDTKRNLAYTGDLYSSEAGRQLSDVNARSNEGLQSKLAELSDKYVQRRISAIPLAAQFAGQQQALDLMPISAAATYGGKSRELKDAEAKSKLAEWIRGRQEKLQGIDALKAAAGTGANYGVPEVSVDQPNPLGDLFGNIGQVGMQELIKQLMMKKAA